MTFTLQQRFERLTNATPPARLADQLHVSRGTIRDYEALSEHHYKAGRPATATRVLVLRHNRPSLTERYTTHSMPTNSKSWVVDPKGSRSRSSHHRRTTPVPRLGKIVGWDKRSASHQRQTVRAPGDLRASGDLRAPGDLQTPGDLRAWVEPAVGGRGGFRLALPTLHSSSFDGLVAVLVESQPSLSCRMREWALGRRYGSLQRSRQRAALLNAELRCISRVVVSPQWRGLGLAVRLVRAALDTATTPYTEAIAAMGRVHPFFEKAGMTAYPRPPLESDTRLLAALGKAGIEPVDLAQLRLTFDRIQTLPDETRVWLLKELSQWHKRTFVRCCYRSDDPLQHLRDAQRQLVAEPIYYLHDNRS